MTFAHYILTRYNIGLYADTPPYPQVQCADAWMHRRLKWFKLTALSIRRQKNQNFTWFVICDPDTPATLCGDIRAQLPGNGQLMFARNLWLNDLHDGIHPVQWPDVEMLVTSRVDNDDILLPDYVKTVQAGVGERAEVIDTLGWVVDYETGDTRVPIWDGRPVSMFITLCETERPFKTVCAWQHSRIHWHFPTRIIPERLWEITLHDENLMNRTHT